VSVLSSASYETHVPGVGLGHSDAVGLGVAVALAVGVGVCAKVVEKMRTNPKSDAKTHCTPSLLRRSGREGWKLFVRGDWKILVVAGVSPARISELQPTRLPLQRTDCEVVFIGGVMESDVHGS